MNDFVSPFDFESSLLSLKDFEFFRERIFELSGISYAEKKKDLIQTRLRTKLNEFNFKDFSEYRSLLEKLPPEHQEWQSFINLLTTNKTDFFREKKHFDYLMTQYLPDWIKRKNKELKIWSAACSSGEEPYTLSMVLSGSLPAAFHFSIDASDIDSKMLQRARNGVYQTSKILKEVPADYQTEMINFGTGEISDWSRISPLVKNKVKFHHHNLLEKVQFAETKYDVIFLRNVLIYFSPKTIETVVANLYEAATPGAILFIGHSESLNGIKSGWKSISPSIYIKKANL